MEYNATSKNYYNVESCRLFPMILASNSCYLESLLAIMYNCNLNPSHFLFDYISFSSFLVLGCDAVALVGNGFCNDETNNADCNYDVGECCIVNANTEYCSECACHLIETCAAGYHPLVANGFCNDEMNIAECNYDGGDCCSNPNMVGNGICNDENNHLGCNFDGGDCCPYPELVANGFCNDETNNFECDYDGEDCCGPDVSCK
jgi:hypothetical protein